MYRKVFRAEKKSDLQIKLPDEYLDKEVEVIAFELVGESGVKRKNINDAVAFFNSVSVDMRNFKFNRDEANER